MMGIHNPREEINFYYIPKCACTLGRKLWYHLHDADRIEGTLSDFNDICSQYPHESPASRGYVLTRNPYDRAVSMYTNLVCSRHVPFVCDIIKQGMGDARSTFINFCQYLLEVKNNDWAGVEHHLYPQTLITDGSASLTRESFSDGRLVIIRCAGSHIDSEIRRNADQYLIDQYKKAYYELTGSRRFDPLIDQFLTLNHFKNATPRLAQFEGDASQIEMVGWEEFPPIESFLTPATRALIAQIYADDFELLGYPLTVATDPVATDPVATDTAGTDPVTNDTAETDPGANDAAETDPGANDTAGTDPVTNDTAETDPGANDMAGTDPVAATSEP